MKRFLVLAVLFALIASSCGNLHSTPKLIQDSGYVLFELDSYNRKLSTAWWHRVIIDSGIVRPAQRTMDFVQWPVAVTDSLRHAVRTADGKSDSTRVQWVSLAPGSIIAKWPAPVLTK